MWNMDFHPYLESKEVPFSGWGGLERPSRGLGLSPLPHHDIMGAKQRALTRHPSITVSAVQVEVSEEAVTVSLPARSEGVLLPLGVHRLSGKPRLLL